MSKSHHYKIEADGTIKSVSTEEREVNLDATIMSRFSADLVYKNAYLLSAGILPDYSGVGNIGICMRKTNTVFTIRLAKLPMRTAFTMKGEHMVPDFKKGDCDKDFTLDWTPPDGMRLYLMLNYRNPMTPDLQFLVAMDAAGKTYRLPLSNLYEDSHICTGEADFNGSSLLDQVAKAWSQFHKSRWNSHLTEESRGREIIPNSQRLFRFKPLEPSGFEQVPLDKGQTWESLSTAVGSAFISENIVV